jgi:hypothetical protein
MAGEIELTVPNLVTQGPAYATQISDDLEVIATHTHDGVNAGAQIDISGQLCNNDLSIVSHNLTNVRSVQLNDNPSQLTGSQDVNCLYVNQNALGFNNDDGIFIPITSGNTLAITTLPFTNLTPRSATVTSNFAILYTDTYNLININSSGGAITGTLPIAAQITPVAAGRLYIFRDVGLAAGTNNITLQVAPASGNTFADGAQTSFVINNYGGYVLLYTDGVSKWYVWGQNVYNNGETVTFNDGNLNLLSSSTMIVDGSSVLDVKGTFGVSNGGEAFIENGSHVLIEDTSSMVFSGTATCQFGTGTSCTFASGSSCTAVSGSTVSINGTLQGTTTGGILTHTGELTVSGGSSTFYSTQSTTILGTVAITGNTSSSIAYSGKGATISNQGMTSLYGETCALTTVSSSGASYTCDSGSTLDNVVGILTDNTGTTWAIALPASPAVGRTITILDASGQDTTTSPGYSVVLNGNGHNIGNLQSATGGSAATQTIGSNGGNAIVGWWAVTVMWTGNVWAIRMLSNFTP